jgi:predicted amidophosphoribosyltransferase
MTRRGLAELLAIIAPPACAACRAPLAGAEEQLCPACRRSLPWLRGPRCPRCGLERHGGRGRPGSPAGCPAGRAAFSRAWAPMAYDGTARALVLALKSRSALPVADVMAAQLAATLPRELRAAPGCTVVPVPPQRARRRARGFDPAGLLACAFAARLGLPLAPVLRRRDSSSRQATAGRAVRRAEGRIDVELRRRGPPGAVLLLDDVHTTGATLDACARALVAGGAVDVIAVTYARTL